MRGMLDRIFVGDTLNFSTAVAGYSAADGWMLRFVLVPRAVSGSAISIDTAADDDDPAAHRAQVTSATTATWTAGTYSWYSWVELGAQKHGVDSGSIELMANPRTASGPLDLRSPARQALDAVQALLLGKATSGTASYRIGERELRSYTMAELLQLESKLKADVAREDQAARLDKGLPSRRQIHVRVNRA